MNEKKIQNCFSLEIYLCRVPYAVPQKKRIDGKSRNNSNKNKNPIYAESPGGNNCGGLIVS